MRDLRKSVLGAILLALLLTLGACGSGEDDGTTGTGGEPEPEQKGSVTIGSDNFAESQIVGEMYAQVLENAGFEVERQLSIESREIRLPAMESGEIDVAPEYLASLLSVIDPEAEASTDPAAVAATLEPLLADRGLMLLDYSNVVDTNAFVTTQEKADEFGLATVSDLAPVASDMTLGAPAECPRRPFCIPGLKKVYRVEFGDFKALEYGATITALAGGEIDVGLLYSTDGSIAENGFVLLEDDKQLQAADNITPLVRVDLDQEAIDLINEVTVALDTATITELNKRANVDVEDPADLAAEFLESKGLL